MINRRFQIGSSERKHRKSAKLHCSRKRMSAKLSLVGLSSGAIQKLRWLSKVNWINLLKVMKLVAEIAEKIHSLISCKQSSMVLRRGG